MFGLPSLSTRHVLLAGEDGVDVGGLATSLVAVRLASWRVIKISRRTATVASLDCREIYVDF